MAEQARKRAEYADLFQLAPNQVGEFIAGVLHAQPRPATRDARASSVISADLERAS